MTVGLRTRFALLVALIGFALTGAGCSGGGSAGVGSTGFDCSGDSTNVLCLQQCNLGCTATGCSRTDIAQNEIIILVFSEEVDPNSVNSSSIRFRTASGDEPVGEFFVNGSRVEFVPTLSVSGGTTFFGFTNGETYTMTLVGGDQNADVVRGTSGRPFGETVTCTLRSTNGIVDLNGVPPSATLVVPNGAQVNSASRDTQIQVEFNELIDVTPFLTGTLSPVAFTVRRTRPAAGGGTECDPQSQPQTLAGSQALSFDAARGVSVLNFVPSQELPGNVCVEVSVTDGVTDLSGQPAQPQVFVFKTEVVALQEFDIEEDFGENLLLDADASAGDWVAGQAVFSEIGGDGRHGEFSLDLAFDTNTTVDGRSVYELDCDQTVIPPANTITGSAIAVTDGRFFFSTMVLPAGTRLRFVGSSPPVITVAGRLDIQGDIEVMGRSIEVAQVANATLGQPGALGGIFAGAGGSGGNRCAGVGTGTGEFNGRDGDDARVIAGHAYLASLSGTGGRGSELYPISGLSADQQFGADPPSPGLFYCLSANSGAGGGGMVAPGAPGNIIGIFSGTTPLPNQGIYMGPIAAGGTAVQMFPFPAATGLARSSLHFLIGGAGGGGSASGCSLSLSLARSWASGAGGGGGGGAVALRSGRSLRLAPTGRLLATGGSAFDYVGTSAGAQVAPAGGGSGGSIVLQTAGSSDLAGSINVEGGAGGYFRRTGSTGIGPSGGVVEAQAGAGSPGMVRFEKMTLPALSELGTMLPPAGPDNVAVLSEVDDLISMRSKFYSTNLIFGPQFSHYVIEAIVDGVAMTFSDDATISSMEAGVGQPLRVLFQAANLDVSTGEIIERRSWRASVRSSANQTGIASDGLNGYRFMLFFDRAFASEVTVTNLKVVYLN